MHPRRHHRHRPGGGGGFPQHGNPLQIPSNPQFPYNPQLYFQNPNSHNPFLNPFLFNASIPQVQTPYAQAPPPAQPPPRPRNAPVDLQATMDRVEAAVAEAKNRIVTAGESVTAWKVAQAALVSLQADSWGTLGVQLNDVSSIRRLLATEGKINAFIHCFVGGQNITSLHDLELAICTNEGIGQFEELGLGPLYHHPLAKHYFSIPSDATEIFKISSEDIIASLCSFMKKCNKRVFSAEELLNCIANDKSVSGKEKLGVRIQNLGLHISYIRQAEKLENAILDRYVKSKEDEKAEEDSTERPNTAPTYEDIQKLKESFNSISDRVKSFSSLCTDSPSNHIHFHYSSGDGSDDSDGNVHAKERSAGSYKSSSNVNATSQRCPYPSAAEEMNRLGLKIEKDEKKDTLKEKLKNEIRDRFKFSTNPRKKRKRKERQERHDATINKYLKTETVTEKSGNKVDWVILSGAMKNFVGIWKDNCQEHSPAVVLDLMINFYGAPKKKALHIFSTLPGVELLNIAVMSIKHGLLDSVYDTVQIFGDHGNASASGSLYNTVQIFEDTSNPLSSASIEINPSVKEGSISNSEKDIEEHHNEVTVEDIIKKVAEYFRLHSVMPNESDLPSGKLFEIVEKLCDCEAWLAAQFSVTEFDSLRCGNFINFMKKHASLLTAEIHTYLNDKPSRPVLEVSMLQDQLGTLLCQAEGNRTDEGSISVSDISFVLRKQFPTISFHIAADVPEEIFLDLIKRQKDQNKPTCVLYSIGLLGKCSPRRLLACPEEISSEDTANDSDASTRFRSHGLLSSSKDAIYALLRVPMLSDLLSWSHWDVLYAPSLGPLSDWLLNEVNGKELLCIATMDGKFIRVDQSATVDQFLEAMVQLSPSHVALKLLSLIALYGGVQDIPASLLKCYAQRAIDTIIKNFPDSEGLGMDGKSLTHENAVKQQGSLDKVLNISTLSVETMESWSSNCKNSLSGSVCGINEGVTKISRFIIECLDYFPLEFRSFGADILVSGLRSVAKDAYSVILRECSQTNHLLMIHDIGLSLGIPEWTLDFQKFSSRATTNIFNSSIALDRPSLSDAPGGTLNHTGDAPEKHIQNYHSVSTSILADSLEEGVPKLCNEDNVLESYANLSVDQQKQYYSGLVNENGIANYKVVQDAVQVIESIRDKEFGLGPNLDHRETCLVKKIQDRLGRALRCLSQELYSQDSHLLLELVQNADDNSYPEDVEPTLVFILQEASIVVLNNERGFSAENIRALCDIGNSTKKGSSAGYIGQKGIGFKSVFRVTDAPEIHSNGFHVKFDITESQIGFVLPTVIPPCNIDMFIQLLSSERYPCNNSQWNTCIVLPFSSKIIEGMGITSIKSMFLDLNPSLLLFLHRLKCIKFVNEPTNTHIIMRREILGDGIVKVSYGQETMTWLVVRKTLLANLIRSDVQNTEISVAFTLEEYDSGDYKPHLSQQPVFAFLPLRHYGLKFILQGDFILPSSREEVDGDSPWNQWLLSEFPDLFVSAEHSFCSLPYFQKCPGKAVTTYMSFVPLIGEVHGFFSRLPHMIISRLRISSCLLLDSPDLTWVLPCRVLRGWNEQFRMLLSDDLLQKHLGLGYLRKDIELSDALAKSLGVQEYGPKLLVEIISSVCHSKDGIMSLGLDWLSAWLGVLCTHSSGYHSATAYCEHDLIYSLKKIPFIPLSDGSCSSVADGPIWLPFDASGVGAERKDSATEFPNLYAKLRIVNPLLFSAAANNTYKMEETGKENVIQILCKIGILQLSSHEIIKNHILEVLSKNKFKDKDSKLMIEYLSFIMLHFQYDCAKCFLEKKSIISELKRCPVLLTDSGYKCPIDEPVHFGMSYKNSVDMDRLIGNQGDKWIEIDAAYINNYSMDSLSFDVTKWRDFFRELGVTDFVQVTCIRRTVSDMQQTFLSDMMPDREHNLPVSYVDDWESSELLYFLATFSSNRCREKCIYLLEVLDKMWDDVYKAYARSCIISQTNETNSTIESSFLKSLTQFEWVASSLDHDLHRPKDVFCDCYDVRSILGDLAPYAVPQVTSKSLLKDIGFKAEVSLDDALDIHNFWRMSKAPFRTSILQMSRFYTFISDEIIRSKLKVNEDFLSSFFIFVPFLGNFRPSDTVLGRFLSPKQLYWRDPTGCAAKAKELNLCSTKDTDSDPFKSLSNIYPGLYDFFVNVCGVPKNPTSNSYLQMLLQLSSIAPPSQAVEVAFQVFVKWADELKSDNPGGILGLRENLQKLDCTVLPTLQDKWVSLHSSFGLVCWPDDDELKRQFKCTDGINFIHFGDLFSGDKEKLSGMVATLMHDIGVPFLSEVVSREAIFYGTHDDREKANLINWVLPYAQRYIYKLYAELYLSLKQSRFDKLSELQVIVVDKLYYKNCLKGRDATTNKRFQCVCLLQGNTLYTTLSADSHSIFLELSRLFFNGSSDLQFANFLHMVKTMAESGSTSKQTEFFIQNSQKVPMLPAEEPAWFLSSLRSSSLKTSQSSKIENSRQVPAPMNSDQSNLTVTQRKPGKCQNWPPTGWKNAPDVNYARENYHLTWPAAPPSDPLPVCPEGESTGLLDTIPLNEDISIPAEVEASVAIELQDESAGGSPDPRPERGSKLRDSMLLPAPERLKLSFPTQDGSQLLKTGRIGEGVAYKYFVDKLGSVNVRWVNEGTETGLPYDLVIGSSDESGREYVEVKATKYAKKDWFELSTREWQFAIEKGDAYSIAYVVLGEKKASVTVLRNPVKLCQQKALHLAILMSRYRKDSSAPS